MPPRTSHSTRNCSLGQEILVEWASHFRKTDRTPPVRVKQRKPAARWFRDNPGKARARCNPLPYAKITNLSNEPTHRQTGNLTRDETKNKDGQDARPDRTTHSGQKKSLKIFLSYS